MGKWLAANRVTVNHSNCHLPAYSLLSPGTAVFPLQWRNVQADQQVYNTAGRFSTSNLTAVNPPLFLSISQRSFFEHTLQREVRSANCKFRYVPPRTMRKSNNASHTNPTHCRRHLRVHPRPQDGGSKFERSTGKFRQH
jgi:hypothetical protein